MKNRRDEDDRPICPVCERAIRSNESVARADDFMVHIDCLSRFEASRARTKDSR